MTGYYCDTFSVESYKGQWIARAILPGDQQAREEHKRAIEYWLAVGKRKFYQ